MAARVGNSSPELAVDEVADTTGGQPQWHQRGDEIGDIQPGAPIFLRDNDHGHEHAKKAAMGDMPPFQTASISSGWLK